MNLDVGRDWWRQQQVDTCSGNGAVFDSELEKSARSPLPFQALLAFTFILLLAPQSVYPFLAPLRIAMLAAAIAITTYVYDCLARGRTFIKFTRPVSLSLAIAAWAVMTLPLSYWPGGSVEFLLGDYFKTLIVFILLAHVIDSQKKLYIISWALVLMAVPLAWTTLENYAQMSSFRTGDRVLGYAAPLTANPNDMALMLNLILPFCVALYLGSQKPLQRLLLAVLVILLVAAVIATFSRAGFLTLGIIFMAYIWLVRKRPERFLVPVVLLLALAALPLVPDSYTDRISTITNVEQDPTGSAQTRLSDMKAAVGYVMEHPLTGAGVGMNALAMNEIRGETWTEIHNVYLQYAVELGLPGMVLFILLYLAVLGCTGNLHARAGRADALDERTLLIADGIRVSLIAFGVAAMFHPVAYHFYFYYIAGLAVALQSIADGQQSALANPDN